MIYYIENCRKKAFSAETFQENPYSNMLLKPEEFNYHQIQEQD
jgi:hypothetical protein